MEVLGLSINHQHAVFGERETYKPNWGSGRWGVGVGVCGGGGAWKGGGGGGEGVPI